MADQVDEDWRSADLPAHTRVALEYAEKLTLSPRKMTQDDVKELRKVGFTDEDVHDITQITAYFNYITRLASGLGVPPEEEMKPWDREDGDW